MPPQVNDTVDDPAAMEFCTRDYSREHLVARLRLDLASVLARDNDVRSIRLARELLSRLRDAPLPTRNPDDLTFVARTRLELAHCDVRLLIFTPLQDGPIMGRSSLPSRRIAPHLLERCDASIASAVATQDDLPPTDRARLFICRAIANYFAQTPATKEQRLQRFAASKDYVRRAAGLFIQAGDMIGVSAAARIADALNEMGPPPSNEPLEHSLFITRSMAIWWTLFGEREVPALAGVYGALTQDLPPLIEDTSWSGGWARWAESKLAQARGGSVRFGRQRSRNALAVLFAWERLETYEREIAIAKHKWTRIDSESMVKIALTTNRHLQSHFRREARKERKRES